MTWMVIDQLDSMIVDPSMLGEFGSQVWRKRKVSILDKNLNRSLFGYHAIYLKSTGRVIIEREDIRQCNGTN